MFKVIQNGPYLIVASKGELPSPVLAWHYLSKQGSFAGPNVRCVSQAVRLPDKCTSKAPFKHFKTLFAFLILNKILQENIFLKNECNAQKYMSRTCLCRLFSGTMLSYIFSSQVNVEIWLCAVSKMEKKVLHKNKPFQYWRWVLE